MLFWLSIANRGSQIHWDPGSAEQLSLGLRCGERCWADLRHRASSVRPSVPVRITLRILEALCEGMGSVRLSVPRGWEGLWLGFGVFLGVEGGCSPVSGSV